MSDILSLTTPEQLERLCEGIARLRAPQLPLFERVASGEICLGQATDRSASWPAKYLTRYAHRPTCFIISDDRGYGFPSCPPDQWACAKRLKYWAAGALVHGAGGEQAHYQQAVLGTLAAKRFALIETTSEHAMVWAKFLAPTPTLVILPESGVHPIQPVTH